MNTQEQISKKCLQQTQRGKCCKNKAKFGDFCGTHTNLTPIRCYDVEDGKRCANICAKGAIYCKTHIYELDGNSGSFMWDLETFQDCDMSATFYNAIKPFDSEVYEIGTNKTAYGLKYPIQDRLRNVKYTDEEKIALVDTELKEVDKLFNDYIEFVKVKYPTEYFVKGDELTHIKHNITRQLKYERKMRRISFISLDMSGKREEIITMINPIRGIDDIKKHIIDKDLNGATHIYNVALFVLGEEDQLKVWNDKLMDTEIYVMVSDGSARPYNLMAKSFKVGDYVRYKPHMGANRAIKYGVITAINDSSYIAIDNRKYRELPNSHAVDWFSNSNDGGIGGTLGVSLSILDCARWSNDPIFTNSNVFVDKEDEE
jgi:hypothetical protein